MTEAIKKIPEALQSMNIAEHNIDQLKQLFPHVFKEGKIDFDDLKRALGEWVEPSKERFGLSWPGKAECMKVIQEPSVATLKPVREESVNFDETENLFIEGDNLEVLKLLQKAYFGKVKMIYIDPPYNTGKEFIYPDKYSEGLQTYLEYSGQVDSEGRKFSTNTEAEGRFHSRWLNMMYPRLYLARNLLREDGVIFISIDDHEQSNLKSLCDMVFGEENFIAQFVWKRRSGAMDSVNNVSADHEYVCCYSKSTIVLNGQNRTFEKYSNPDNDPRGEWIADNLSAGKPGGDTHYAIIDPANGREYWPPKGRYWPYSRKTMAQKIEEGRVIFPKEGGSTPMLKRFRDEAIKTKIPVSSWIEQPNRAEISQGTLVSPLNSQATKDLKDLFGDKVFLYPKPAQLIKSLMSQATDDDCIVLDFFAGSGTSAQAVLEYNQENAGKRKFILVQMPEILDADDAASLMGYKSISDIARNRIKRVLPKLTSDNLDKGFKSFSLSYSNFRVWDEKNIEQLEQQLTLHVDHVDKTAQPEDILYELLLKAGFELTTKIDKISLAGKDVYSVADGALLICLDKNITSELIDALAECDPLQVICLDEGFKGNDQLKTNAVQTFKSRAQSKETEILFRTV
jgi:adenine-specific DNA-methyltransferase